MPTCDSISPVDGTATLSTSSHPKGAHPRTSMPALGVGKTMQYSGINGIYVFFRYTDNQKVMVVLSQNDAAQEIVMSRFAEITTGYNKLRNVMTGEITPLGTTLKVAAKGSYVFELMK
ncbi:MAG: hypothetical protein EBT66_03295 [Bacteroidetes bacterium]|nr:hypothetical protein [Bacteroidota bacterium]